MAVKRLRAREIALISAFIVIFILVSYLSNQYSYALEGLVKLRGPLGMLFYFFLTTLAEIIGPVTVLPFLPLAVKLWGSFLTAVLTVNGWVAGSLIAFFIARRYGKPIVKKFIDILSYAIGLLTEMQWPLYLLATALGFMPVAFLLSYGVRLPIGIQASIGIIALIITFFGYRRAKRKVLFWLKNQ